MTTTTDKLAEALRDCVAALDSVSQPGSLQTAAQLNAVCALADYDEQAEPSIAARLAYALRTYRGAYGNCGTPWQQVAADLARDALAAYDAENGATVYTLAELRNGTGFPKGARFVMVGADA